MRKAQGFQPIKHFAHKGKVRRNARHIIDLQATQELKLSPWEQLFGTKTTRVDFERINWKGLVVYSAATFDPTPRLRQRMRGRAA
jgi:hypothetical protein